MWVCVSVCVWKVREHFYISVHYVLVYVCNIVYVSCCLLAIGTLLMLVSTYSKVQLLQLIIQNKYICSLKCVSSFVSEDSIFHCSGPLFEKYCPQVKWFSCAVHPRLWL